MEGSKIETELIKKLLGIWDDEEFVLGVITDLETDREKKAVIDYIDQGKDIDPSSIALLSLHIDLERNKTQAS